MKIESKDQVKWGVTYRLSDGRLCEAEADHPSPEKVVVNVEPDGEELTVYTGPCDDGSLAIVETES